MKTKTVNPSDARLKLLKGIKELTDAVGSTLGPRGNTVIIQDNSTTRGVRVTKDGVTVAKSINPSDDLEGIAITMLREAAEKTATAAGDGTTTSIVLARALLNAGLNQAKHGRNIYEVIDEIRHYTGVITGIIEKDVAIPLTDDLMEAVATISANNNSEIGELIASAYKDVGRDGVLTPERSPTGETYYEARSGVTIERGWTSPLFISNRKRRECVLEDCYVLVSDMEISSITSIPDEVMKPIVRDNKSLLIISEASANLVEPLAANVVRGNIRACHIEPPSFGAKRHDMTRDLASALGATYISEKTGQSLNSLKLSDLAHVDRVVVDKGTTIIMPSDDTHKEYAKTLSEMYESEKDAKEKKWLKKRIAALSGGVGVVYAGGDTDVEVKELYDRIEDAILAVESAISLGIIPGGGVGMLDAISLAEYVPDYIAKALDRPRRLLFENGGIDDPAGDQHLYGVGWCAKTLEYGNMIERGIIDPAKVTINAIKNAVSVATTIMGTKSVVIRDE